MCGLFLARLPGRDDGKRRTMNPSLIPAVFIFYGILSIAYAGTLFLYFKNRKDQSAQSWAIASLLVGISVLVTVFRSDIPLVVSYVLANALAYVSYRYQGFALDALLGERLDFRRLAARGAAEVCAHAIALLAIGQWLGPVYQTVFVSGAVLGVSLHCGLLAVRLYRSESVNLALLLAITFFLAALLWLLRIPLAIAEVSVSAFDASAINVAIFIAIFLVAIFRYLIYPGLLLVRANDEKQQLLIDGLLRANKTVSTGALSASLAHELNQPLGASGLNIAFLKMQLASDTLTPQVGAEVLQALHDDNQRAASIVRSLRSIFSDEPLQPAVHDLGELVRSLMVVVGPVLKKAGIRYECGPLAGMHVVGSASEMQQVFLNLLNNAIQALTGAGTPDPCIGIRATREGEMLRLVFSDNGPGVSPEKAPWLFELLVTDRKEGMGLGLWLCRHIVSRHGGTVWYEPGERGGSRFCIALPAPRAVIQDIGHAPAAG